jgi:hypothetical protein
VREREHRGERGYEINDDAGGAGSLTDFRGRSVVRSAKTLKILGARRRHMIARWRFAKPKSVTVHGAAVRLVDGRRVEFDRLKKSVVEWQ